MSLTDNAAECREEAIKNLVINDVHHTKAVINAVLYDQQMSVKRAALQKITTQLHNFESVSTRLRMELLEHLFSSPQCWFFFRAVFTISFFKFAI